MQRIHWPNTNEGLTTMAKELENAGVYSVLLPYGPEGQDFLLHIPDIFRSTKNIKMMLALGAYAVTPEYAAKSFYSAQQYGNNRLDLNLVAGRYDDYFANMAIDYYPGDKSVMDTHEARVALTESWMERFVHILKRQRFMPKLAVVGSSENTLRIANTYTDYIIINGWILHSDIMSKIQNCKPILVIDPLILDPGQDPSNVEYHNYEFTKQMNHDIMGTYEEVRKKICEISEKHNINEFMIHTDQLDISRLLRLVKDMTS